MIKIQASIYSIAPFDAGLGTTISFRWDGNMAFKNQCIIKDNDTNTTIYDNTVDSFESYHVLDLTKFTTPLQNGKKYLAYILIYDKHGTVSDIQTNGSLFLCLCSPVFNFINIPSENTLTASTQTLTLSYSQENGELLNEWSITIYSSSKTEVSTSGEKYGADVLEYTFSGFVNNTDYYIRAEGKTVNGMSVDTGFVLIKIRYSTNGVFSLLQPVNVAEKGVINLACNIISAEGELLSDGVYINGTYLDLRDNTLVYDRGFAFQDDFTLVFIFYGAKINQCVCSFASDNDELLGYVLYRVGRFGTPEYQACYELQVKSGTMQLTNFSNKIDVPADDDKVGVSIVRKEGLYNIEIINLGKAGV